MSTSLKARPAELSDAGAIAEIYNQGIEDRTATFETAPRTAEAIRELLRTRAGRYPAVVVEDGPRILGFAWTSEYRPRSAYGGVAEFAVYVARGARGQGVGRLAMEALITEAEQHSFWKLVSRIFVENLASRGLCADLGFRANVQRLKRSYGTFRATRVGRRPGDRRAPPGGRRPGRAAIVGIDIFRCPKNCDTQLS